MNFLLVCGGTAGHINPALAIAVELRRLMQDSKILFVGAGKELEKKLIPQAGFHLVNIRMSGLKRGISPDEIIYNLKTARNLASAGIKAGKLIRRFEPNAVIGTAGYICYPILKKASQMGIPTVIHGSDAVPGLTTKLLSATVDKVLVSFQGMEQFYRRPERVVFTGTPVRNGFRSPPEGMKREGTITTPDTIEVQSQNAPLSPLMRGYSGENLEHDQKLECKTPAKPHFATTDKRLPKPLVLSFWGSQGAEKMNNIIAEFIKLNIDNGSFNHIHAAGNMDRLQEMKNRLKRLGAPDALPPGIVIREYIDNMPSVMATADLVLCRSGASTLAELTVMGKPAVLVPSPYVTNNHQEENAKQLQKAGGAAVLLEKDCTGETLFNTVSSLLEDRDALSRMSGAQKKLAAPDAVDRIVEVVLSLCN
jgi:UDP-N-acetylglucosamine--N-acetylmuramyl-(pentapeptide) pyrophosphoryl-undecaprenol N-acetylglucosamine transferase